MNAQAAAGAALLGVAARSATPLAGGDLSAVLRVGLADGREVVVKGGPAPRLEAEMLGAIAAGGAPAPRVLAVSDDVLVLELRASGGALGAAWASLGAALAKLHAVAGAQYGWHADYAFGGVPIENSAGDDWAAFWAERRLLVHVPYVPRSLGKRIELLPARIGDFLPRRPKACLLHGDLWGGNVLVAAGHVSGLIDPACYYGHGEVDVAMLGLFDRPGADFFEAYGALEPGSGARLAIYRLWPALVHVRLFGEGYLSMVEGLVSKVVLF